MVSSSPQSSMTESVSSILWIERLPNEIQFRIAEYVCDGKSGLDALNLAKTSPLQRDAVCVALRHTLRGCFARHADGLVSEWVEVFEDVQVLQLHEHPPNFRLLSSSSLRVVILEDEPLQLEALAKSGVNLERLELTICYNTPAYLVCRFLGEVTFKTFRLHDSYGLFFQHLDAGELVAGCQGVETVIFDDHCGIHTCVSEFLTNLSSLRELVISMENIDDLSGILPVIKSPERLRVTSWQSHPCQLIQLSKDTGILLKELQIMSVLGEDDILELSQLIRDIPELEKLRVHLQPGAERFLPGMPFLENLEIWWNGDSDVSDDEEFYYSPKEGTAMKIVEGLPSLTALRMFGIALSGTEICALVEELGSRLQEFGMSIAPQSTTKQERLLTMMKLISAHASRLTNLELILDWREMDSLGDSDLITWDLKQEMLLRLDRLRRQNICLNLEDIEDLIMKWPHENDKSDDADTKENSRYGILSLRRCRRGMNEEGGVSHVISLARLLETGCDGVEKDMDAAIQLYKQAVRMGDGGDAIMKLWNLTEEGGHESLEPKAGGALELILEMDKRKIKTLPHFADVFYDGTKSMRPNYRAAEIVLQLAVDKGYIDHCAKKLATLVRFGYDGMAPDLSRAVFLYKCLVDHYDDGDALYALADCLRLGYGVEAPDPAAARKYLERGVRKNYFDCMNLLGVLLQEGYEGVPSNPEAAKDLFEQANKHGSEKAMGHLGVLYFEGWGGRSSNLRMAANLFETVLMRSRNPVVLRLLGELVEKGYDEHDPNPKRAAELYEESITGGDAWACVCLADLVAYGYDNVPPDPERAIRLLEQAIESGNRQEQAAALRGYGDLLLDGSGDLKPKPIKAAEYYAKAIFQGDDRSLWCLGDMLKRGYGDVSADPALAYKLYQRAIDEYGDPTAMRKLASLLKRGRGSVKPDPVRAVELYRQAIEGGSVSSYTSLARMFQEGYENVPQDLEQAAQLYKKGADLGDPEAMCRLGEMLYKGFCSNFPNPLAAIELYDRAIDEHNYGKAMRYLAQLIEEGCLDKPPNLEAANALYERGAAVGDEVSKLCMTRLIETGYGDVQPNIEEARLLYCKIVSGSKRNDVVAKAMSFLGSMFEKKGFHDSSKIAVAAEWYRRSNEKHATSICLYRLAVLTRKGFDGTPPNVCAAVTLLRSAVEYENRAEPFFELADIIRNGYDTAEPDVEAADMLDEQGNMLLWASLDINS